MTSGSLLPTAYRLLPTAYHPLPSAYCPLPTTHYPKPKPNLHDVRQQVASGLLECLLLCDARVHRVVEGVAPVLVLVLAGGGGA